MLYKSKNIPHLRFAFIMPIIVLNVVYPAIEHPYHPKINNKGD
ncbi:hypothetical protein BTH41_01268 [Bacillus mycoides]|nr:hypothetical protein BTH41_01268 [Bacillus mycoides]